MNSGVVACLFIVFAILGFISGSQWKEMELEDKCEIEENSLSK